MRRPRAFTCSRLRAEPLPPPPRKPLGYLHEEGWAIARSSSPCKCGTCGHSPLSTPPPNSQGSGLRTPEAARTFSNMHPWRPTGGGTPPRADSPVASLDSRARGNAVARASAASRRTPFSAADRSSAKPARRIVLFNTQPEPLGVNGNNTVAAGGGVVVSSVGPAERKRASDGTGGDGTGNVCGEATPVSWASYSLAASLSASSATTTTTTASAATTTASAGASAGGASEEGRQEFNGAAAAAAAAVSAEMYSVPTMAILRPSLFVTSDPSASDHDAQIPPPPHASIITNSATITIVTHNQAEDSGEGFFVKGLDEWKAPETAGTFSLGAPSQASGVGRRRRTLRLRVGG